MTYLLFDLFISVVLAFGVIVYGPSGITLLICGTVSGLLSWRLDRDSAIFLGNWATGLLLVVDSVIFGVILSSEPTGVDDPMPRYYIVLVPLIGWFVHLPIGLAMVRLGVTIGERVGGRFHSR